MSHTPGPWCYRKGQLIRTFVVGRENGYLITMGVNREEDARLMAAAPELLEACIIARNYLNSGFSDGPRESEVREALENAVRKAKGSEEIPCERDH